MNSNDLRKQIKVLNNHIDLKKMEIRQDYAAFKKKLFSPASILLGSSLLIGWWLLSKRKSSRQTKQVTVPIKESPSRRLLNGLEVASVLVNLLSVVSTITKKIS